MSEAKNNTEESMEQADDKDIKVNAVTDTIVDVIKNEVIVNDAIINRPRGG